MHTMRDKQQLMQCKACSRAKRLRIPTTNVACKNAFGIALPVQTLVMRTAFEWDLAATSHLIYHYEPQRLNSIP